MLPDHDLPQRLAEALARPLPGHEAQRRMEPDLSFGRHGHRPAGDARRAAVMLLLYRRRDAWHLPLVLRPESMAAHAGQIGFPGGAVEPGETSRQAAARELEEELGVGAESYEMLGALSPLNLYVTNFAVTPWVGIAPEAPPLRPDPAEVADVLEVPLAHLADASHRGTCRRRRGGLVLTAPCITWQGHEIWGATAMMLSELLAVLGASSAPAGSC